MTYTAVILRPADVSLWAFTPADFHACWLRFLLLQVSVIEAASNSTYRIIVSQSTGDGEIFSSDFLSALSSDFNNGTNSSSADTATTLNRTFAGTTVPVDVYSVSSAANASTLCSALTSSNSGSVARPCRTC